MAPQRSFVVGETVTMMVDVQAAGARGYIDVPTVEVTDFRLRGSSTPLLASSFQHVTTGQYSLVLPTDSLAPGVYDITVRVVGGSSPEAVSLAKGSFTLEAA